MVKATQSNHTNPKLRTKFTPKKLMAIPSVHIQKLVNDDLLKKNRNWALPRFDKITGQSYRLKKQGSVKNVLGYRGLGVVLIGAAKKGDVVIASNLPGRKVSKTMRRMYLKQGYWFMGCWMFSKYESCMRANVRVSTGPISVEIPNVKLKSMSDHILRKRGYDIQEKGTHCVLVATRAIAAGENLILENYGNKSRFPFGYNDYLKVEQEVYTKYYDSVAKGKPGEITCHRCCENILSKKKLSHRFICNKDTYFRKLLKERGFLIETSNQREC